MRSAPKRRTPHGSHLAVHILPFIVVRVFVFDVLMGITASATSLYSPTRGFFGHIVQRELLLLLRRPVRRLVCAVRIVDFFVL